MCIVNLYCIVWSPNTLSLSSRSTSIEVCYVVFSFVTVRDGKVRKSVERIFSIWEERSVYPEEVIAQFKASLNKKEKEREKQREKEKEKEKETPPANGWFVTSHVDQI